MPETSPSTTLHCPTCGYNLTGLTRDVCPECGEPFDPREIRRAIAHERRSMYFQASMLLAPAAAFAAPIVWRVPMGVGPVIAFALVLAAVVLMLVVPWRIAGSLPVSGEPMAAEMFVASLSLVAAEVIFTLTAFGVGVMCAGSIG